MRRCWLLAMLSVVGLLAVGDGWAPDRTAAQSVKPPPRDVRQGPHQQILLADKAAEDNDAPDKADPNKADPNKAAADSGAADPAAKNPFTKNVKVTYTETHMIVESDGIPNHKTAKFPNEFNPNTIRKQNYRFRIPLHPKVADKPTPTPFGPIGVALNGIPFYNQYNREGGDAVQLETFDSCCGHPDPGGRYHYHKFPVCVKSPFKDTPGKHSPLVGYAFDGYGIYGPRGENGKPPKDLDECNGHSDSERGYHYHATAAYPYIIGAYHGVVEASNVDRPPPGGGPGGGPDGGPGGGPPGGGPPGGGPPGRRRGPPGFGPPPGGGPPGGGPPGGGPPGGPPPGGPGF